MYAEHGGLYVHAEDPAELLKALMDYQSPEGLGRWVDRDG
jgi:hypothetical protein